MNVPLSERQSQTVAAAVTIVAGVVILATVLGLGWGIAAFLRAFADVFLPLVVGGLAALVFRPYYLWLRQRARLPVPAAVAAVFLSGLLPLAALLWFFGTLIAEQVVELVKHAPRWWESVRGWAETRLPQVVEFFETTPTGQRLRGMLEAQQSHLGAALEGMGARAFSAGAGIVRGAGAALSWAVLPVYFAFFLTSEPRPIDTARVLPFLKKSTREDVLHLVHEFVDIIVAFFRGQLIIAFLQGVLYALGFGLVGLKYGVVLGFVLGFLNLIPYLGSIIGLATALPLAFFQEEGGLGLLAATLVVFVVVQMIEGYLLTPKIMGDRTGLHFMVIIVAVFFWGSALGGILGMVLAIPLTAFLVSVWRLAVEKYIPEIV